MEHDDILADGKLRELRKNANMTQEEVAEAVDCSSRWYQYVETGRGNPSPELTERLSRVLSPNDGAAEEA